MTERESVSFECEVNLDDVNGQWCINNSRLKAKDDIKVKHEGKLSSILVGPAEMVSSGIGKQF